MLRPAMILVALALAAPGCREDRCKSASPALQLDVLLAAGVDGSRSTSLALTIDASGLHKEQTLDVTGKLADGRTSIAVSMGGKTTGSFVAEIGAEARDAQGSAMARGKGRYDATGDACNFFSLTLAPVAGDAAGDATVDGPRGDARQQGDTRKLDGPVSKKDSSIDVLTKKDTPQPDAPKKDTPQPDAPKPDMPKPDAPKKDMPKDAPKPLDAAVAACIPGVTAVNQGPTTAACVPMLTAAVTQCQAATLCNSGAGWHLCTASEFRTRFPVTSGAPPPASFQDAWIASCILDGMAPFSPSNTVCTCVGGAVVGTPVTWDCSAGNMLTLAPTSHVGIKTTASCARAGINAVTAAGYWTSSAATAGLGRALCCK